MANFISTLKAVLSLDNKEFSNGLKKSQKQTQALGSEFGKLGGMIAGAFSVQVIASFSNELAKLHVDIENSTRAFERFGATNKYMNDLRRSTGGMLDNLTLMQQSIQAVNLNLNAADLPKYFEFATIRAAETGVAVEYLVNSIVTGIGRQSRLVLDNLGISLKELNAEIARTGDFGLAAFNLLNKAIEETDLDVNEVVSGVIQLETALGNLKQAIASSWLGQFFDEAAQKLAKLIRQTYGDYGGKLPVTKGNVIMEKSIPYAGEENLKRALEDQLSIYDKQVKAIQEGANWSEEKLKFKREELAVTAKNIALVQQELNLRNQQELQTPTDTSVPEETKLARDTRNFDVPSTVQLYENRIEALKLLQQNLLATGESAAYLESEINELELAIRGLEEPLSVAQETFANTVIELDKVIDKSLELGDVLENAIGNAIAIFADSIGQLIGGDTENALATFINGIAGLMKQFGALLISWGVAQLALKASIANPYVAIAAGAALVAIGGLMSAKGGQVTGSASSSYGGSYSGYAGNYGGAFDYNREIVMVARGDDLVGIINRKGFDDGVNL